MPAYLTMMSKPASQHRIHRFWAPLGRAPLSRSHHLHFQNSIRAQDHQQQRHLPAEWSDEYRLLILQFPSGTETEGFRCPNFRPERTPGLGPHCGGRPSADERSGQPLAVRGGQTHRLRKGRRETRKPGRETRKGRREPRKPARERPGWQAIVGTRRTRQRLKCGKRGRGKVPSGLGSGSSPPNAAGSSPVTDAGPAGRARAQRGVINPQTAAESRRSQTPVPLPRTNSVARRGGDSPGTDPGTPQER